MLHVIFIDNHGQIINDVPSGFSNVLIPQNAFVMRIADDTKSYSNQTLTKLFEIDNTSYSKILEYTLKGDYQFIDINVQDFGGFTVVFNQLSAQFIGNDPSSNIYDFSSYGSGSSIDFSTIVVALNSIATALSALTNLSNLTDLANIILAINNKDNQSNIVNSLNNIFCYNNGYSCIKQVQLDNNSSTSEVTKRYASLLNCLNRLTLVFTKLKSSGISVDIENNDKLFTIISDLISTGGNPISQSGYNSVQALSIFKSISNKLDNIEINLEQNLPFTTIVNNDYIDNCVSASVAYNKKIENIPFN